jgi:hypothetical protein
MAENVKRRVAAARLAVAFVAAGTIAGATAWAQAGPPPPIADESAAYLKSPKVTGDDIVDGSLFFKDLHKGEVASADSFFRFKKATTGFKKATKATLGHIKGELGELKTQVDGIKGELISSYAKLSETDARYMKIDASVIDGDGQVLTTSKQVGLQSFTRLAEVAGMFTVDAEGPMVRITNIGSLPIQHSSCPAAQGGATPPGEIAPGAHIDCFGDGSVMPVQLIDAAGPGGGPRVATLNLFSFSWGANTYKSTVQILVGL